jgi:hypothetical protein
VSGAALLVLLALNLFAAGSGASDQSNPRSFASR